MTEDAHEDAPRGRRDGPVAIVTGASQGIGWVGAFQVKVFGALRMMRAAWPHLAAARGSVVNIGGIGARTPRDAFAMTGPLSAALLAFLLSPGGEWLQGAIIDVDGGRTKGL